MNMLINWPKKGATNSKGSEIFNIPFSLQRYQYEFCITKDKQQRKNLSFHLRFTPFTEICFAHKTNSKSVIQITVDALKTNSKNDGSCFRGKPISSLHFLFICEPPRACLQTSLLNNYFLSLEDVSCNVPFSVDIFINLLKSPVGLLLKANLSRRGRG